MTDPVEGRRKSIRRQVHGPRTIFVKLFSASCDGPGVVRLSYAVSRCNRVFGSGEGVLDLQGRIDGRLCKMGSPRAVGDVWVYALMAESRARPDGADSPAAEIGEERRLEGLVAGGDAYQDAASEQLVVRAMQASSNGASTQADNQPTPSALCASSFHPSSPSPSSVPPRPRDLPHPAACRISLAVDPKPVVSVADGRPDGAINRGDGRLRASSIKPVAPTVVGPSPQQKPSAFPLFCL